MLAWNFSVGPLADIVYSWVFFWVSTWQHLVLSVSAKSIYDRSACCLAGVVSMNRCSGVGGSSFCVCVCVWRHVVCTCADILFCSWRALNIPLLLSVLDIEKAIVLTAWQPFSSTHYLVHNVGGRWKLPSYVTLRVGQDVPRREATSGQNFCSHTYKRA